MPSIAASTKYTLRLTCRAAKADIDSGTAEIKNVLVAVTKDGKTVTTSIPVNKKLKDMMTGTPDDGKKPDDGKPDDGKNDGGKKGSSGGGCDAGVGGLALALGAAFLLKRKA